MYFFQNPGKQTQQVHSKKPKSKTIRTGIFLTFEILAMVCINTSCLVNSKLVLNRLCFCFFMK